MRGRFGAVGSRFFFFTLLLPSPPPFSALGDGFARFVPAAAAGTKTGTAGTGAAHCCAGGAACVTRHPCQRCGVKGACAGAVP